MSSVPKHKKAVTYLRENSLLILTELRKIPYLRLQLLDKLYSSMSYITVGHAFIINELTVYFKYSIFKHKHT